MENLKKSFLVRGNNIVGFGGSGEENTIESVSVNGTPIAPDENKNVDITVPSIDGLTKDADLATVAKSGNYEDLNNKPEIPSIEGLAKTTDIPTKVSQLENDSNYLSSIPEEYVTETELNAKGYLTEHQDLSAYATKNEIPTVPSKVSELTNDSNYQTAEQVNSAVTTEIAKVVADAPEDFNTLKEMSDWIAGHEDDASAMNSAISDNKIAIAALQTGKADKSEIPTSLPADGGNSATVNNHTVETNVPADAVFTDTIYDDTEVKESIVELNSNLVESADYLVPKKLNDSSSVINGYVDMGKFYLGSSFGTVCVPCEKGKTYVITKKQGERFVVGTCNTIPTTGTIINNVIINNTATELKVKNTDDNYVIAFVYNASVDTLSRDEIINSVVIKELRYSNVNLTEYVDNVNESLSDYGLNNKFTGNLVAGYHNPTTGVYDASNEYTVCDLTKYTCTASDNVRLIAEGTLTGVYIVWYNGSSYLSYSAVSTKDLSAIAPPNATAFTINLQNSSKISPSSVSHVGVYVGNEIDKLKNDLDTLEFGEVAGGENLFVAKHDGYYSSDGKINKSADATIYECSDIIQFNGSNIYISTDKAYTSLQDGRGAWVGIVCFDSNKNFINESYLSGYMGSALKYNFTLPSGVCYVGMSSMKSVNVCFSEKEIDYTPYIPSVKILAKQNESLDKQGLLNKFDGVWNAGSLNEFGNFYTTSDASTSNYIPCNSNSNITIKVSNVTNYFDVCIAEYTDSSFIKDSAYIIKKGKQSISIKVSSTTTRIRIVFYSVAPSSALQLNTAVYVNNAIDELKNDLSKKNNYYTIGANKTVTIKRKQPYVPIMIIVADSSQTSNENGLYIWGVWGFSTITNGNGITVTKGDDNITLKIENGRSTMTGILLVSDQMLEVVS